MSRKLLPIVTLCVLVVGLFVMPVAAQDERWVGADELDVAPLDCPEGVTPAPEATEAAPGEAPAYNGGQPTDAPDLSGQPITLIDVPKLIGIGYFNATSAGMQEAAAELGNVTVTTDGPTEGDIAQQVEFIDRYITQGVDGVL